MGGRKEIKSVYDGVSIGRTTSRASPADQMAGAARSSERSGQMVANANTDNSMLGA